MSTDGFFESLRPPDDEQFGTHRLEEAVCRYASGTAAEILAGVDAAVLSFGGTSKQVDDKTAIALKRTAIVDAISPQLSRSSS